MKSATCCILCIFSEKSNMHLNLKRTVTPNKNNLQFKSLSIELNHHPPLCLCTSLGNQTEFFHLQSPKPPSLSSNPQRSHLPVLTSGFKRHQLVCLTSAYQKSLLEIHLAWPSVPSSHARFCPENDSFAFKKPKQNCKRLFMQLFPALGKVQVDVGSTLAEVWIGEELLDLETWRTISNTQKV